MLSSSSKNPNNHVPQERASEFSSVADTANFASDTTSDNDIAKATVNSKDTFRINPIIENDVAHEGDPERSNTAIRDGVTPEATKRDDVVDGKEYSSTSVGVTTATTAMDNSKYSDEFRMNPMHKSSSHLFLDDSDSDETLDDYEKGFFYTGVASQRPTVIEKEGSIPFVNDSGIGKPSSESNTDTASEKPSELKPPTVRFEITPKVAGSRTQRDINFSDVALQRPAVTETKRSVSFNDDSVIGEPSFDSINDADVSEALEIEESVDTFEMTPTLPQSQTRRRLCYSFVAKLKGNMVPRYDTCCCLVTSISVASTMIILILVWSNNLRKQQQGGLPIIAHPASLFPSIHPTSPTETHPPTSSIGFFPSMAPSIRPTFHYDSYYPTSLPIAMTTSTPSTDHQTPSPTLISITTSDPTAVIPTSVPTISTPSTSSPSTVAPLSFHPTHTPSHATSPSPSAIAPPPVNSANISLVQLPGSPFHSNQKNSHFGHSLSLSSHPNRLAIGTPLFDGPEGPESGLVTVYSSQNGTEDDLSYGVGYNLYGDPFNNRFGWSTCLSSDGTTLVVSGGISRRRRDDHHVTAYYYSDTKGEWQQRGQSLFGGGDDDDNDALSTFGFGSSLSLSHNGSRLAVGSQTGAFVFDYEAFLGQWSLVGGEMNEEMIQDYDDGRHADVALSEDGMRLAVGGAHHYYSTGRVRVYDIRDDISATGEGVFTQVGQTMVGQFINDQWGYSLSLSGHGSVVAAGCFHVNGGNYIKVYTLRENSDKKEWFPLKKGDGLVANGKDNKMFGSSASLSSRGDLLVVGLVNKEHQSRAVLYGLNRDALLWRQIGQVDGMEKNDQGRFTVSISPDGRYFATAAISGSGGDMTDNGRVHIFEIVDENHI